MTRWTIALGIAAGVLMGPPLQADTLNTTADSYTNATKPTTRYGLAANLRVKGDHTAFVRFDLGTLPEGVPISKATLRLFVGPITSGGAITVHLVAAPWTEEQLSHSNRPAYGAALPNVLAVNPSLFADYVTVDVTPAVQAWLDGQPNYGLALVGDAFVSVDFESEESIATGHGMELEVIPVGPAGEQGGSGPTGAQGPQGEPGLLGPAGPQGELGAAGPTGAAGSQGPAGPTGPQGTTGGTGPQGAQGEAGAQGLAGPSGPQGETGQAGLQGATGDTGAQGLAGPEGAQGTPGATGPQGIQGEAGLQGPAGAVGPQGETGPTGSQGPTGDAGAQGAQGNAGPSGPQGTTGPQGAAGLQGPPGSQGPVGAPGATGPQGPAGTNGVSAWETVSGPIAFAPAFANASSVANCSAGKKAVGGGWDSFNGANSSLYMWANKPTAAGTGWQVSVTNFSAATNFAIRATAICVTAP